MPALVKALEETPAFPAPLKLIQAFPPEKSGSHAKDDVDFTLAVNNALLQREAAPEQIPAILKAAAEKTPALIAGVLAAEGQRNPVNVETNADGSFRVRTRIQAIGYPDREVIMLALLRRAHVEFRLVSPESDAKAKALLKNPPKGYAAAKTQNGKPCLTRTAAPDGMPLPFDYIPERTDEFEPGYIPVFLEGGALATGKDLARVSMGTTLRRGELGITAAFNDPAVSDRLIEAGKGRRIAIMVNGRVEGVAAIRSGGGRGEVEFSDKSLLGRSGELVPALQAAMLPAPLKIIPPKEIQP